MRKVIMIVIVLGNIMMSNAALAENSWLKITDPYFSVDWVSKYVYSSGFVAGKGSAFQPAGGITLNNWLKPSFWASVPSNPERFDKDGVSEIDLCLDGVFGPVQFGGAYYLMQSLGKFRNDAAQVSVQIGDNHDFGKLNVRYMFRLEYDMPVSGPYNKKTSGLYVFPMINFSYPPTNSLTISLGIKGVIDTGGYGADPAGLMVLAPSFAYRLTEKRTINIGLDVHKVVIHSPSEPRRDEYVLKFGMPF